MKAIIFDIDDTLYDRGAVIARAVFMATGYQVRDIQGFYRMYKRWSDEAFDLCEGGQMSLDDSRQYRIRKAMEEVGWPISREAAKGFHGYYKEELDHISLSPVLEEMFRVLGEQGVIMGVLTNGPGPHQLAKYSSLGLDRWIPRKNVFVSGFMGCAKPDPNCFRIVEEGLGLPPEGLFMVGDSYGSDIAPALEAGWDALWFDRLGEDPSGGREPTWRVSTEEELASFLLPVGVSVTRPGRGML